MLRLIRTTEDAAEFVVWFEQNKEVVHEKGWFGKSVLYLAVQFQAGREIVQLLVNAAPNLVGEIRTEEIGQRTPLALAMSNQTHHTSISAMLGGCPAAVRIKDFEGCTPLMVSHNSCTTSCYW
jgi:hypothetical protein